jgi:hypothetical protein
MVLQALCSKFAKTPRRIEATIRRIADALELLIDGR